MRGNKRRGTVDNEVSVTEAVTPGRMILRVCVLFERPVCLQQACARCVFPACKRMYHERPNVTDEKRQRVGRNATVIQQMPECSNVARGNCPEENAQQCEVGRGTRQKRHRNAERNDA